MLAKQKRHLIWLGLSLCWAAFLGLLGPAMLSAQSFILPVLALLIFFFLATATITAIDCLTDINKE